MKKSIYTLFITLMLTFSVSLFSQDPPPPNGGSNPTTNDNIPVGGGAPVGSGLALLLVLGAAYGSQKVYKLKRSKHA